MSLAAGFLPTMGRDLRKKISGGRRILLLGLLLGWAASRVVHEYAQHKEEELRKRAADERDEGGEAEPAASDAALAGQEPAP